MTTDLGTDVLPSGLTSAEAARRLARSGSNLLPTERRPSAAAALLRQFTHLFALLLWGATVLALVAGCFPRSRWAPSHQTPVLVRREVGWAPAATLLIAASRSAQLVVVGVRGASGLVGARLGSISHAVLHHAACPVAVVHPA